MTLTLAKEKRRFLLFLPLIVIPFLCLVFHTLGGGRGPAKDKRTGAMGLNTQLPALPFDLRKAFQNKLATYEQANTDSLRKAQYQRQDPYHRDSFVPMRHSIAPPRPAPLAPFADRRADQLEQQLARLQQSLGQPQPVVRPATGASGRMSWAPAHGSPIPDNAGVSAPDPQLDRLNVLLDKVIRIQHPQEQQAAPASAPSHPADEIFPADTNANCIAAIIPEEQTLTAGETVVLRMTDSIRVHGRTLPAGELVYGTVTLNNDRMLIHIGSLREDRNLYGTDWQVYDLDGLPGIHIPGILSREVAKQTADQGVNALNVMTLDPSLGAQAAGAGIQAAKTLVSRKVRQVRVTVRAGYQVLLRNPHAVEAPPLSLFVLQKETAFRPPEIPSDGPALERCRNQGMELTLRMLCIRDSCLWFGLEWINHSPIVYTPAYARWYIRDRRVFKRTAMQEQTMDARFATTLPAVGSDSARHSFTGFGPFALPKDKELVLEIGEKGGGRTLVLVIPHKAILKAKAYAKASQQ